MERIIDRLDQWMAATNRNDNKVTVECELSVGLINKARVGKSDLGKKTIEKILKKYQDINPLWLRSGIGEMFSRDLSQSPNPILFSDNSSEFTEQRKHDIFYRLLEILKREGISINEYEKNHSIFPGTFNNAIKRADKKITIGWITGILDDYPRYSYDWIYYGSGSMLRDNMKDFTLRTDKCIGEQNIPLYNFDAAAGLVAIFNQHQIEPTDYIRIPDIPPVDGAIYVKGESMSPLIKNGDVVMFKKKEVNIDSILWGEIYILSFINDGDSYTAVKYIRKSNQPDHIRLESFNPDFAPKDIPMSSITALAIVKASLTFHLME